VKTRSGAGCTDTALGPGVYGCTLQLSSANLLPQRGVSALYKSSLVVSKTPTPSKCNCILFDRRGRTFGLSKLSFYLGGVVIVSRAIDDGDLILFDPPTYPSFLLFVPSCTSLPFHTSSLVLPLLPSLCSLTRFILSLSLTLAPYCNSGLVPCWRVSTVSSLLAGGQCFLGELIGPRPCAEPGVNPHLSFRPAILDHMCVGTAALI
jgi:hypothetical protein